MFMFFSLLLLLSLWFSGKIYVVGGGNGSDLASVEEYNPVTDRWRQVASMHTPRKHVAVACLDGYVYAIGGCNNATKHMSVERSAQ